MNRRFGQLSLAPVHVHFKTAACAQSSNGTAGPIRRQRGQKRNFAGMTLQERFGNGGGETEVGVGLIVSPVVQIIRERILHQRAEPLFHFLAAFEARPNSGVPGSNPAATNLPLYYSQPAQAELNALPNTLSSLQQATSNPLASAGFTSPIYTVRPDGTIGDDGIDCGPARASKACRKDQP